MSKYDYLIVGSGLFGSVFAYQAKKNGKKCLVIDKRPHIGGNIYTEEIEGIFSIQAIKKYGIILIVLQNLIDTQIHQLQIIKEKFTIYHLI